MGEEKSNRSLSSVFKVACTKVLKTRIFTFHYLVLDLTDREKSSSYDSLKIKELEYEDFLTGNRDVFTPVKLKLIRERLRDDRYQCYGIVDNGILLYSTWMSRKVLTMPNGQQFALADTQGLLEDSFCDSRARGKGYHSKMNLFRIDRFRDLGMKEIVAIVLDGNTPAMKVQLKSGFKEKFRFKSGEIFGVPFTTKLKR